MAITETRCYCIEYLFAAIANTDSSRFLSPGSMLELNIWTFLCNVLERPKIHLKIQLFVSVAVISAGKDSQPQLIYTFPFGLGILELCLTSVTFKDFMVLQRNFIDHNNNVTKNKNATPFLQKTRATPSISPLSLFFFFYLGAGVTSNGWIVEYLVNARHVMGAVLSEPFFQFMNPF
ncbi:hypothetical protein CI102_8908 [Trichoderma harzianum]|nr:hypothetical protein CI102_8908 [Trichoderma harzianum]